MTTTVNGGRLPVLDRRPFHRAEARMAATAEADNTQPLVKVSAYVGSEARSCRSAANPDSWVPANRRAKSHRTRAAVSGSTSSRCTLLPHAACGLLGCGPVFSGCAERVRVRTPPHAPQSPCAYRWCWATDTNSHDPYGRGPAFTRRPAPRLPPENPRQPATIGDNW